MSPAATDGWQCLDCRSPLSSSDGALACDGCGANYPVVGGVPIAIGAPRSYLAALLDRLRDRVAVETVRAEHARAIAGREALIEPALRRLQAVAEAEAAWGRTLSALLAPLRAALDGGAIETDARVAPRSVQELDYELRDATRYLLKDWGPGQELSDGSDYIFSALDSACPDGGQSMAVLGCGAGGLLPACAARFGRVWGIDLSATALFAARELLAGRRLTVALPLRTADGVRAGAIELAPPAPAAANIELAVMDAGQTAFPDGAFSCVITQLLLDIVAAPAKVADEVRRILRDGGVWLNYGPAGRPDRAWNFDNVETAALMRARGFDVLQTSARRAPHLDYSAVDPSVRFHSHVCYLTVARKAAAGANPGGSSRTLGER